MIIKNWVEILLSSIAFSIIYVVCAIKLQRLKNICANNFSSLLIILHKSITITVNLIRSPVTWLSSITIHCNYLQSRLSIFSNVVFTWSMTKIMLRFKKYVFEQFNRSNQWKINLCAETANKGLKSDTSVLCSAKNHGLLYRNCKFHPHGSVCMLCVYYCFPRTIANCRKLLPSLPWFLVIFS